jgi:putative hydrolase of the HAD superfamily
MSTNPARDSNANAFAAVLFDLDDTLFDYHEYARAGLRSAANLVERKTGRRVHDDLVDLYFDPTVDAGTFDALLERYHLPRLTVDELVHAYHDSRGDLVPYEETPRVLSTLRDGHALGLVTDGRGGHSKLDRLGLREYFDAVLVTPTIGSSKHEHEVFDRVLADLDVQPVDAMYVGDDPRVDFRVPNELGMRTVRLRRGRYVHLDPADESHEPDYELDSLAALLTDVPGVAVDPEPMGG